MAFVPKMRAAFPSKKYCRRALSETVISVAEGKLSCHASGCRLLTQRRQASSSGLNCKANWSRAESSAVTSRLVSGRVTSSY